MPLLHLAILAVVQGITEFLPISSSAHLVLVPKLLDLPDQGLVLDVAVHIGTLGAVMLYLWRDMANMLVGIGQAVRGQNAPGARLLGYLLIGTVPVVGAGFALNHYYPGGIRSLEVIAWATLCFGILLMVIDRVGMTLMRIEHLRIGEVLFIGIAQMLALIPGTSRAGICMTAARFLGMERADAARFSMLLSIPAIVGAGTLKVHELWQSGDVALGNDAFIAAIMACAAALVAIALMMAWLRHASFTPFAVYRIILGVVLLGYVYNVI